QLQSHDLSFEKLTAKKFRFGWKEITLAGVILTILATGVLFYRQSRNRDWAQENLKKVEELAKSDKTFEAYDLAQEIQTYLPNDKDLAKLLPLIADNLSVKTEPLG